MFNLLDTLYSFGYAMVNAADTVISVLTTSFSLFGTEVSILSLLLPSVFLTILIVQIALWVVHG